MAETSLTRQQKNRKNIQKSKKITLDQGKYYTTAAGLAIAQGAL